MGEKIVDLQLAGLRLWQSDGGLGVTDDAVRLAEFAARMAPHARRVCELGSGAGGLLLMLWARLDGADCTGVEIMPENVRLARRSLLLNAVVPDLRRQLRFICADWRELGGRGDYDLVVSNPPYLSEHCGRLSPNVLKRAATHEMFGGLGDMLLAANGLLAAGGSLCVVLPEQRGEEAVKLLQGMNMDVPVQEKFARRVMILAKKISEK